MSEVRAAPRTTYRLYIGGVFPRAASGRTFEVHGADGTFLASAALAAGRDARDAVVAARSAFPAWSHAAGYDRGQALYRVAEVLEDHRAQFAAQLCRAACCAPDAAEAEVEAAVDRWIWYAGWADKITQVRGTVNPVAGAFGTVSLPEPVGVTAVLAPPDSALLGLVSVLAPVIVSGNTAVLVASERYPLLAVAFAEALAAARLPAGVVNVLTGEVAEISPWLAAHQEVNAIDLAGAPGPLADDLAVAAAGNLKRVVRFPAADWNAEPGLERMFATLETKTIWHPLGT
ncbi:MAG TPA: aldehyde dehydrogenase family protein [Trebonia sp.]|jgi:acyl-CoA reductase-like NAD-dependent aldehyde dehydrogenase